MLGSRKLDGATKRLTGQSKSLRTGSTRQLSEGTGSAVNSRRMLEEVAEKEEEEEGEEDRETGEEGEEGEEGVPAAVEASLSVASGPSVDVGESEGGGGAVARAN
ncbi:unnamed protein product [Arctogadus glacialis]